MITDFLVPLPFINLLLSGLPSWSRTNYIDMDENAQSSPHKEPDVEEIEQCPPVHPNPGGRDDRCELPEEFRVREPPPPSYPDPFPLSPSMEEDAWYVYAEDLGYVSTLCPSPPSDVDNLNPPDSPQSICTEHPTFVDDTDNEVINEDTSSFMEHPSPPIDDQSPTTRLKHQRRS